MDVVDEENITESEKCELEFEEIDSNSEDTEEEDSDRDEGDTDSKAENPRKALLIQAQLVKLYASSLTFQALHANIILGTRNG